MPSPRQSASFTPEYCELAYNYCLLDATNEELGDFFDVASRTIDTGSPCTPTSPRAVREGRAFADTEVARGLHARAIGFSHPPDTQACTFWLRNRRRQNWREKAAPEVEPWPDIDVLEKAGREAVRNAGG
jgi:hypothetical protein